MSDSEGFNDEFPIVANPVATDITLKQDKSATTIGPYLLIGRLGAGGFGEVWLAERSGRLACTKVALKLPRNFTASEEEVRREAHAWVQAGGHPNVIPIFEADIYQGRLVIVSEYAEEGSLAGWLERQKHVVASVAAEMLDGILGGLIHLHNRGVIHRDLKPANVLLQGGKPRLTDFGLAKVVSGITSSGHVAGTPRYMAPEAFEGVYSAQVDIWAAGIILYELLTGTAPFPQREYAALVEAILTKNPDPLPPSVPPRIGDIVRIALAKRSEERFESAVAMRMALQTATHSIPASQFKPGDWLCRRCGFPNFARRTVCAGCAAPCETPNVSGPPQANMRPGDWLCPSCSTHNFSRREICHKCMTVRPQPPLRESDWLCPSCNAHNFGRRQACHQCKAARQSDN